MGLVFAGYCGVLWGLFLITGKNVSIGQVFGSAWPPNATSSAPATSGA
jgi:hypothetical protein